MGLHAAERDQRRRPLGRGPARAWAGPARPSHCEVCDDPEPALLKLEQNLARLFEVTVQQQLIAPTAAIVRPHCVQVSEHLYAATGPSANTYVVRRRRVRRCYSTTTSPALTTSWARGADSSSTPSPRWPRFGIRHIDVALNTHYRDDHVAGLNFPREHNGTEIWTMGAVADLLQHPWAYRVPCLWRHPTPATRSIADGERFIWHEFTFDGPSQSWPHGVRRCFSPRSMGSGWAMIGDGLLADGAGGLRGGGPPAPGQGSRSYP